MHADSLQLAWGVDFRRLWLPPLFFAVAASVLFHVFVCGCLSWQSAPLVREAAMPVELALVAGEPNRKPFATRRVTRPVIREASTTPTRATALAEPPAPVAPSAPESAPVPAATTATSTVSTSGAPTSDPVKVYLEALRLALDARKIFPAAARALGQHGTVRVAFAIQRDGNFSEATVLESSGVPRLDRAALTLVKDLGHFRALDESVHSAPWRIEVPIVYDAD